MMNTTLDNREIQILAQADALTALADVLRGAGCSDLTPAQTSDLLHAAGWGDHHLLVSQWSELAAALDAIDREAWSIEHHRLFEGATVCPLNQTAYVRRDKGAILGDLCGFYQAFGLQPRSDCGEKPDHLATELEFLSLLLVMLAQASEAGREEQRAIVADAAGHFAADHLAPWLGAAAQHLRRTSGLPLFLALADALETTWAALAEQYGWPSLEVDAAVDMDLEPPTDDCGPIGDPVPTLTVAGRPLASAPSHNQG